jgi:hypothetical protein
MLEIYCTQVHIRWNWASVMNRFYFLADNPTIVHPYQVAKEINQELIFNTAWFNHLTLLVSETARFRSVATRRTTSPGGPRANEIFPGGGILGGWLFECPNSFEAVEMQWMDDTALCGRNHNRIGPLGSGATGNGAWNSLFLFACGVFGFSHGTPMMTASGVTFRACNVDKLGIATIITGQQIAWPPSRQITRRTLK